MFLSASTPRIKIVVFSCERFSHKFDGKSLDELAAKKYDDPTGSVQFTVPVVVQRARLLRTRALFQDWSAEFLVEIDTTLIDTANLETWLDIAGRRLGIDDWRPAKTGRFGRFICTDIVKEAS